MTSREQILTSIRTALGRTEGDAATPLPPPMLRVPLMDPKALVETFVQNFEKLAGKSIVVGAASDVVPALVQIVQGKRVVASNAPYLETCGVRAMPGIQTGFTDPSAWREACVSADVGITSVDYALAQTGTFVMLASAQEARLASLLPLTHVAVIPRSRIVANLDTLFGILPAPAEQTSSMVFITGPSRTADIEQILVRGVHGPGEVYAVIVEQD